MKRRQLLNAAITRVCGDKEKSYGSPENNFQNIADFWGIYLNKKITPSDVSLMLILMKVARTMNNGGTEDTYIDIAGYAACSAELFEQGETK